MKTPKPHLVRLEEVATFLGGSTPSRARPQYFGGSIPWVKTTDLNNGLISETEESLSPLGLTESSCKMIPAQAVLVAMYGGFNQIGRTGLLQQDSAINQALTAVIPDPQKLNPAFLLEWLNFRVGYWKRFAGSSRKDPNITKGDVEDFPVPSMPVDQQIASAHILAIWNASIEKTGGLISAKLRRHEILSNKLLFGHARFGNRNTKTTRSLHWFSAPSDWQVVEIGKVAREVSALNSSDDGLPVLSCTKYDGLVDSLEYFDKQVFSHDTSKYKVVGRGQFAYATNHIEEGSIGYQDFLDAGLVSPIYTVFQSDAKKIDDGTSTSCSRLKNYARFFRREPTHQWIGAVACAGKTSPVFIFPFRRSTNNAKSTPCLMMLSGKSFCCKRRSKRSNSRSAA